MPRSLTTLPTFDLEKDAVTAVVETPRGHRSKLKYDPKRQAFVAERYLPEGISFPHDFGFIPSTRGDDGDPVDVLVLADQPEFPGCIVPVRLIGIIEVEQKESSGERVKNDRLLGVAIASIHYETVTELDDLPTTIVDQIETFFRLSAEAAGKRFVATGRHGASRARAALDRRRIDASGRQRKHRRPVKARRSR